MTTPHRPASPTQSLPAAPSPRPASPGPGAAKTPRPRLRQPAALPVFFRPEQAAPREAVQVSPSAAKPEAVMASWARLGVPLEVRSFEPVTRAGLSRVHDRGYVDAVLDLVEPNGFGNRSAAVAASLPFTSGAFVAAAEHVARHGGVAVAPVSGFHHAGFDFGGGFCTFNGLALAAARLLDLGVGTVGVLDLDAHHGNGTEDIFAKVPGLGERVRHYTRGSPHYRGDARTAPAFLAHLPRLLEAWHAEGVKVVLYQAGADPHVDDPIGCRFLTTEQLEARDEAVFTTCARLGLPVAWDLAGGYQEDASKPWPESVRAVLDVHDHTLLACAAAFGVRPPTLVLEVGAEGGSLSLFARHVGDAWEYSTNVCDQTLLLLGEEDAEVVDRSGPWTRDWQAALAQLDRYPWAELYPVAVHAAFSEPVLAAVAARLRAERGSDGHLERLERWRRVAARPRPAVE